MPAKPPTIGHLADTRARWREYRSAAAVRAVADAYRQFINGID